MDINIISKIGYGLYVMSVHDESKDNGCIINTAMQVSDTPLRLAVTVNKKNYTCEIASKNKEFNISILSESTPFSIFKTFGFVSGRDVDKFKEISFKRSKNGLSYLSKNVSGYMSCRITDEINLGTHKMFICDLVDSKILSNEEPVTYAYYHKYIKPKPSSEKKDSKKGWRCVVCGYMYEGEELPEDFICPICKHGIADFVKVSY